MLNLLNLALYFDEFQDNCARVIGIVLCASHLNFVINFTFEFFYEF